MRGIKGRTQRSGATNKTEENNMQAKKQRSERKVKHGAQVVGRSLDHVVRVTIRAIGNCEAPPLGYLYKDGDQYVLKSVNDGIHGIPIRDGDVIFPYIYPNAPLERSARSDDTLRGVVVP